MIIQILSQNTTQTRKIGELLGQLLLQTPPTKQAMVIGLDGELGSGKTTFIQGLARGLKIKERILSPTFVIFRKFRVNRVRRVKRGAKYFYHIDCYRLGQSKELWDLGLDEIIYNPQNIVAIEWLDRIKKSISRYPALIKIEFKWLTQTSRQIKVHIGRRR